MSKKSSYSANYYGHNGTKFYVNSASGISRERLDEITDEKVNADGSIPLALVCKDCPDVIIGRVAIRKKIEKRCGVSKRTANRYLDAFANFDSAYGVDAMSVDSLNALCTTIKIALEKSRGRSNNNLIRWEVNL